MEALRKMGKRRKQYGLSKRQSLRLMRDIGDYLERGDREIFLNVFNSGICLNVKKMALDFIHHQIDHLNGRKGQK